MQPDPFTDVDDRSIVDWIDRELLAGPAEAPALRLGRPVSRGELRDLVHTRTAELTAAGLGPGGTVSLRLPPGLAFVVNLLAAWRCAAQVSLLDHRLTDFETDQALDRLRPQLLICPDGPVRARVLRGWTEVGVRTVVRGGDPAADDNALLQLSSGSTGPSKVIGRTAADLRTELARYRRIEGTPAAGERIVLLASMVHVLGLVGGLLFGLTVGATVELPEFLTTGTILDLVRAEDRPATIIGVPFHIDLLASVADPPHLPQLNRMTVGGELVHPRTAAAFARRYPNAPLGVMYGMTEVGVIATDLFGAHRPALAPAPGLTVREDSGQLVVARARSPYVGLAAAGRWVQGWLYTRDAGRVDPGTGLITVTGRLDSQVSVGGLKVDLTEVEQTLAALPGVAEAVVIFDGAIEAFVSLREDGDLAEIERGIAERMATFKRPRQLHLLPHLPRTATGKLVRDQRLLRAAPPVPAEALAPAATLSRNRKEGS